jgi:protein-S-isoprenylcysteine O-methyltransferase Ste14
MYSLKQCGEKITLTKTSFIGCLTVAFGGWIRWKCYQAMGKQFTFQHTIQKQHKLITHGPYSIVRHPSYSGSTIFWIGFCLWYGSKGSWLRESGFLETMPGRIYVGAFVTWMILNMAALYNLMPKEDEGLRNLLGKEWDVYAGRGPYTLVPGLI